MTKQGGRWDRDRIGVLLDGGRGGIEPNRGFKRSVRVQTDGECLRQEDQTTNGRLQRKREKHKKGKRKWVVSGEDVGQVSTGGERKMRTTLSGLCKRGRQGTK